MGEQEGVGIVAAAVVFALAVAGIVVLSLLPVIAEIVQHAKGDKGEETPQVASCLF